MNYIIIGSVAITTIYYLNKRNNDKKIKELKMIISEINNDIKFKIMDKKIEDINKLYEDFNKKIDELDNKIKHIHLKFNNLCLSYNDFVNPHSGGYRNAYPLLIFDNNNKHLLEESPFDTLDSTKRFVVKKSDAEIAYNDYKKIFNDLYDTGLYID